MGNEEIKTGGDWLRKPQTEIAVDCHVHLFPEKLFSAIRRWFAKVDWQIPYPYRTESVLAHLRAFGVRECWALPYAHKPGTADKLNAWMGETARRHAMVRGFFTVHPDDEDVGALARRAIDEYGLVGMKIHAEVQKVDVGDDRLDPAFLALEESGLPCVLHSGNAPYPQPIDRLDVRHVARRMAKNPNLKAVIAHLGAPQTRDYLDLCAKYPGLHLEVSFTLVPEHIAETEPVARELGAFADRVLFGSDFPNITFSYAEQVDNWLRLDWVKQHHNAFFGGNARRLLTASSS